MTSEAVDRAGRASSSPSLDGRRFRALTSSSRGQLSGETEFAFSQDGPILQARYGGAIRLGFLLGLAAGDTIEFRYVRVDSDGSISSGHSVDTIEVLPDGRLRLHERWEWESRDGNGTSVLAEIRR
jgi:hypothetical protein